MKTLTVSEERDLLAKLWVAKVALARLAGETSNDPLKMAEAIRCWCNASKAAEAGLSREYADYQDARHRLTEANLGVAGMVAKRFRRFKLDYEDLFGEAVCGLMEAIDRFDTSRQTRLSTYATWWVRRAVQHAVAAQSHAVSITPHHMNTFRKIHQFREANLVASGRRVTDKEASRAAGCCVHTVQFLDVVTNTTAPLDLDADYGRRQVSIEDTQQKVDDILCRVTEPERRFLKARFGLDDTAPHTRQQIATQCSITKRRVQLFEGRLLSKLQETMAE